MVVNPNPQSISKHYKSEHGLEITVENVLYFLPQISFYRLHYVCCRMYIQVACVTAFSARYKKEEFRFASCGWEIMMIVKNIGDGGLNQPCV